MWKRFGKRQVQEAVAALQDDGEVRFKRPSVAAFFLGGGFHNLPVVSAAAFGNPARRVAECEGFVVPAAEIGRAKRDGTPAAPSKSAAESIRLWIEKNLATYCGDDVRDFYSVVYDNDGKVRVYRRA